MLSPPAPLKAVCSRGAVKAEEPLSACFAESHWLSEQELNHGLLLL